MHKFLFHLFLIITYYVIGAYATTDVSRLLKGATVPIYDSNCYCPSCGSKIPLRNQIPIISYLINKGKCNQCHSMISLSDLLPEIILPIGFLLISYLLHFSVLAYLLCICLFEGYKILSIVHHKPRENDFLKNFIVSLIFNIFIFLLLGFFFFIANSL